MSDTNVAIDAYVNDLITLEEARGVALRDLGVEVKDDPEKCSNTTIDGVLVWLASASKGQPICLGEANDLGYSVTVYSSEEDGIEGVAVHEGNVLVGVIGSVPKGEL